MVQWSLYDSTYNIGSDTGSSQLTNSKQLVVVAIRGSVTDDDWDNNFKTQFVPWDNKFVEMKNDVAENLSNHISELTNPIILVTGHSLGAAVANLVAAKLNEKVTQDNIQDSSLIAQNDSRGELCSPDIKAATPAEASLCPTVQYKTIKKRTLDNQSSVLFFI